MIPLTIIVDSLGGWLALAFILVFVVKAVLAAVGGDIDADVDTDVDTDVDVDVNTDGFGFSASDFFSLKGFLNFGVGFCSSWALFGLNSWWSALLAVGVGLLTMFLLIFAYRACMKLDSKIVKENPNNLLHRVGTIYNVTDSVVVLQLPINGRIDEILTLPDTDEDIHNFTAGNMAYISRVELDLPDEYNTHVKYYVRPYNNQ